MKHRVFIHLVVEGDVLDAIGAVDRALDTGAIQATIEELACEDDCFEIKETQSLLMGDVRRLLDAEAKPASPRGTCGNPKCERCPRIARGETCSPGCPGWHIDPGVGKVFSCDACGLWPDEGELQIHLHALMDAHLPPSKECEGNCPGWGVFDSGERGLEIECCNECHNRQGVSDDNMATLIAIGAFTQWLPGKTIAARDPARDLPPDDEDR